MQILIEPSDVLLFRDGRPFSAEDGHRARSIFPPTPNTIQGVIRSKVLADRCGRYQEYKNGCWGCPEQNNCTIPNEIGRPAANGKGNYGEMYLKGALIAKYQPPDVTAYFPVPADVVQVKEKNNSATSPQLQSLKPLQQQLPGQNDLPFSLLPLWTPETRPVEAIEGYWTHKEMSDYLLGKCPNDFTKVKELYDKEARLGIEVDNSKQTVREGRLYQAEFVRCQDKVGLYLEIEGIKQLSATPDSDRGIMAIGGENRAASYLKTPKLDWGNLNNQLKDSFKDSCGFKIYLATPGIFENNNFDSQKGQGWLPSWLKTEIINGTVYIKGEYNGIFVELVAAAIGRYQTIGGWDIAYNRQKPTHRAVPAGSVYYFTTTASPEKVLKAFHWQNLAEDEQERQIGYGLSLVGIWNYCQLT